MKTLMLAVSMLAAGPLAAQAPDPKVSELERKLDALAGEVERLKLGAETGGEPKAGLRRAALGGYGEFAYQNFRGRRQDDKTAGRRDSLDLRRAVLYVGYAFNDWASLHTEFEFEHASTEGGGSVSAEMAALDFTPWGRVLGLRAGLMLMPMGLINEAHEPTAYHGVNRPSVEQRIIPATWSENGVGLFGAAGPFVYRSYVVAGLTAAKDGGRDGFDASGIREGRTGGGRSVAEDLAWVGRADVTPVPGVTAGGSLYLGQADQRVENTPSVPVSLWEVHAHGEWRGVELKALYAATHVGNAGQLNAAQGFAGNKSVGAEQFGGYVEAAYDALSLWDAGNGRTLAPFLRWERYDTQKSVPDGFTKDPANSRVEYTVGLTFKPFTQVAVKFDHQFLKNQARTGTGQTNLGIGYIF